MNVLGLKITSHDTGAALIAGSRVVAIAEERLNRVKHSFNMFPELSIPYCLNTLGVQPEEIDHIVMDQVGLRSEIRMEELFREKMGDMFPNAEIHVINHHDAHAASAFFCSPFDEAAVLIYDGSGEKFETAVGIPAAETETLYAGRDATLSELQKTTHLRDENKFVYTFGVGKLYSLLSTLYLGFGNYNEGKMMGLASYGTDSLLQNFPMERWFKEKSDHLFCNANVIFKRPSLGEQTRGINSLHDFRWRSKRKLKHILGKIFGNRRIHTSGSEKNIITDPNFLPAIKLPRPPRAENIPLPDTYYSSVAYAAQKILEAVAVRWGKKLMKRSPSENLCVAGGVGLNIDANKNFLDAVGFKRIFVQPAASDTGIGLGCALYGYHVIGKQPRFWEMKSASLGRPYTEKEITDALEKRSAEINVEKSDDVATETAKLISEGKIIGWFQDGSEYGPRALGNRSILCDARIKDMKDILNDRVKHRESWRPFAASVLRDHMSEFFELEHESPFMLLAAQVRKEKQEMIPSVVHVDGTCRIQSVTKENNEAYFNLLTAFHKQTGTPLILNTSFNLGGDPIVETPKDALDTFLKTNIDHLILGDYIISKK